MKRVGVGGGGWVKVEVKVEVDMISEALDGLLLLELVDVGRSTGL